jgi:hypothetical protein
LIFLAPEARKKIAHGGTVGLIGKKQKPRQGRQNLGFCRIAFCRSCRSLSILNPDPTVSLWATFGRCSAASVRQKIKKPPDCSSGFCVSIENRKSEIVNQ